MKSILTCLEEINERKLCGACRKERTLFEFEDQKGFGEYSYMIPGFYSKKYDLPENSKDVEVLIVAHSHGGSNVKEDFRNQYEVEKEINLIYNYYFQENFKSYHQEQMYIFLKALDKLNISWYFTDLVKCYVSIEKKEVAGQKRKLNNFKLAVKHCRSYLDNQLEISSPKIVVCLGTEVFEEIKKSLNFRAKFSHGSNTSLERSFVISSYFPSGRTADRWVKAGKWEPILNIIKKIVS